MAVRCVLIKRDEKNDSRTLPVKTSIRLKIKRKDAVAMTSITQR